MKKINIYYANCLQKYDNCYYPNHIEINGVDDLKTIFSHDYVCAKYKNYYRGTNTFLGADCLHTDADNDHSDNPDDWITPEIIARVFYDVNFIIHYSKSHMKEKTGKDGKVYSSRPRFHVVFSCKYYTDVDEYAALKQRIYNFFPYFDDNALDAARFMAGTENPKVEIHEGNLTIEDFLDSIEDDKFAALDDVIPEGRRNATMHTIAVKLLKRYGNTKEASNIFLKENERCSPPLERDELKTIWKSASKFFNNTISKNPDYIKPSEYNKVEEIKWDEPLKFEKVSLPSFPIDALPIEIANYVKAVAETTQTPIDMAATAALAIMALCVQGKYKVQAKPDWIEPLNLYTLIIAEPSERKSAIVSLMSKVLIDYEIEYNKKEAAKFEFSKMDKQKLENKKKSFESAYAKGKKTKEEMMELAKEIADFKELTAKKLYVDDITTEKLTSVLQDNNGKTGIISSEGGIFDVLAGMYSKNVNIDVFLKAYSGDSIRVDRIGRNSELIANPCLTILLSVQPSVLSNFIQNCTFEGKGLTTRFLYAIPTSFIGKRKYKTEGIPAGVKAEYEKKIVELLNEDDDISFQYITMLLTPDASDLLESYFNENEIAMVSDNQDIKSWCGKIVGNVLRIAGIISRFSQDGISTFLNPNAKMYVDKDHVEKAIAIGRYFTAHAKAAHSLMGIDPTIKQYEYVLEAIKRNKLKEFTKREILRVCRSFKNTDALIPVIKKLTDYGYIQEKSELKRSNSSTFLVNPSIFNGNENN